MLLENRRQLIDVLTSQQQIYAPHQKHHEHRNQHHHRHHHSQSHRRHSASRRNYEVSAARVDGELSGRISADCKYSLTKMDAENKCDDSSSRLPRTTAATTRSLRFEDGLNLTNLRYASASAAHTRGLRGQGESSISNPTPFRSNENLSFVMPVELKIQC